MGTCFKLMRLTMLMVSASLGFALPLQAGEVVRFVYFEQFEPFSWNDGGQMKGIFVDVVNEVFQKHLKIEVRHEGLPWKRAQQMVRAGEADGMCTISTAERLRYALPTVYPIVETEFKIFTGAGNPRLETLKGVEKPSELKGFALIDILGSGWSKTHLKGMNVHYEQSYERVFELLATGRYDAAIRNSAQTNFLIHKFGFAGKIIELPQPMMTDPQSYRILISKQSALSNRLSEINNALRQIRDDGTLRLILSRYP